MKSSFALVLSLILILCSVGFGYADTRGYVWTYEYQTMPEGLAEIEYYVTEEQKDKAVSKESVWKHWVELEYGLTDHWDISMYQQFKQTNKSSSSAFEYDGFKVRARYRFLEKDELPVDTLVYAEYIRNDNLDKNNVFEGKVILAKDIGLFNIAYNQIAKAEFKDDGADTIHEYAFGASVEVVPALRVGIESKGSYSDDKFAIGPSVSLIANKFWVSLGAVGGLNKITDDLQTRMILGIHF